MDVINVAISSITFLSLKQKILLRKKLDSLDELALLSIEELENFTGRSLKRIYWNGRETVMLAKRSVSIMKTLGIESVLFEDEAYPYLLKQTINAPYMLFYRGNIEVLKKNCVSVVGTRDICADSARSTFDFAKQAADEDFCVVSGLANGIDSFAHKGALSSEKLGSTCAVLPCGIDTIVPTGHKTLVAQILKRGGVYLSEYIPGTPAEPWRFVQRNRIIAALSPATVVMQASCGSGSLITADFAVDYARDVMFHKSCFSKESLLKAQKKEAVLRRSNKESDQQKLLHSPEKYLEEGSPLISSFNEYKEALKNEPGMYVVKNTGQLLLGLDVEE